MGAKDLRYGRIGRGHTIPYGTLANASYDLWKTVYYHGYRHDKDLPPLPEVEFCIEPIVDPEEEFVRVELRDKISEMLDSLTPREAKVLRLRFGIGVAADMSLEEIGTCFDVTRERIRQIEAKALRKLRNPYRSDILRQFISDEYIRTTADKAREIEQARRRIANYEMAIQSKQLIKRKAPEEIARSIAAPTDTHWVEALEKIAPELYEALKQHVDSYINEFLPN